MDPKRILIICLCFLSILLLTQILELAIIISIIISILIFKIPEESVLKFAGIILLSFLLYPMVGMYFAVVTAYGLFVVIFNKLNEGRYAFGIALLLLIFCPMLLVMGRNISAETSAIFAYLFLVVGSVQKIIFLIKKKPLIQPLE